jgi:hypothetical protein
MALGNTARLPRRAACQVAQKLTIDSAALAVKASLKATS